MTIRFHSEARKEFFEASEYYEEQVMGLGDNFINEVEKSARCNSTTAGFRE